MVKERAPLLPLQCDDPVAEFIAKYHLTGPDEATYYSIPLHVTPDCHLLYGIHRYITGLSNSNKVDEHTYQPVVDHINRARHDDRLCNLRFATEPQNLVNPL
jgi:hypothetical protein